eukprot:TRINITY_DN5816_c0_g2_i1.p1 TRINITY_DN5816_c0_g2~~TRINITY_DN5816_c0_g2_i1.p1  ORF type:complete len:386 (-),score=45.37 TRINITY_DN5816_c0_g2_i1:46-1203(-)
MAEGNLVWQLKQQRVAGISMTVGHRVRGFLCVFSGLIVLLLGMVYRSVSENPFDVAHDYTDERIDADSGVSAFEIDIKEKVEPPVLVYYELTQFYQNHKTVVNSVSLSQLKSPQSMAYAKESFGQCAPFIADDSDRVYYPCGLSAHSVFNDTFAIAIKLADADEYERLPVSESSEDIAWMEDIGKYKNLDPDSKAPDGNLNQEALNMWLLEQFPPVACDQRVFSDKKPWVPVTVALRKDTGSPDCTGYMKRPVCKFERKGEAFECAGDYEIRQIKDWGIESGHFNVWMRTAGLPRFRKLWGKIDKALPANSKLKVFVSNVFPTTPFGGRKSIVLATGPPTLGGIAFWIVGAYLIVYGLVILAFGSSDEPLVCPAYSRLEESALTG